MAGRADLIDKIQYRMTCPGIGGGVRADLRSDEDYAAGAFFQAPKVVNGAVKGAILCGRAYQKLGFAVCPLPEDKRSDIIQAVKA